MKKFRINGEYVIKARNPLAARADFVKLFPATKVESIKEEQDENVKLITKAAAAGQMRFGVQRSLQLGFSDLPLFQKDTQTELF